MKKKIIFFVANITLLIILFFIIEGIIWYQENEKLRNLGVFPPSIERLAFHKGIKNFKFNPDTFPRPQNGWGRAVEGLEYNKKPIVIFGCSYAYGYTLENEQTLSYKLSRITKRPVYNRAYTGWGIQHMLYQTKLEKLYNQIPEPKDVIFVYINDHIRRLYILTFSSWNILEEEQNLRYKEKEGQLFEIKNENPILKQIKRSYLVNKIHHQYVLKTILQDKNNKKNYDFALKHFVEAKKEMQKYWKDTNYTVFFYEEYSDDEYLKEKLKQEGFDVVSIKELTSINLNSAKYLLENHHPNEDAWELITPLLAKKLNL